MTTEHHPSDVELAAFAAAQSYAIATHVRGCASCRAFVRAMEHVGGVVLDGLPPASLAGGSLAEVLARIDKPAPPSRPAARAGPSSRAGIPGSPSGAPRRSFGQWKRIARSQRLSNGLASAALIILSLGTTYLVAEYAFFRHADDYAASTATTGKVAIGGSTTGNIETPGDADWFKVMLAKGTTYRFHLEGSDTGQGTLQYPVLRLLDGMGNELLSDAGSVDGPGPGWTSVQSYTAPSTGTYHVSCEASGNHIGTYKVSATQLSTSTNHPPVITIPARTRRASTWATPTTTSAQSSPRPSKTEISESKPTSTARW